MKKYIILNFAYGFGPFLRTAELALAVNDNLEKQTGQRFQIIVPLAYGENQKKIMREEFGEVIDKNPDEFLLAEDLGRELNRIFYSGYDYGRSLQIMFANYDSVQRNVKNYIENGFEAETFTGQKINIKKDEIALEIGRAPRVFFDVQPSYYTTFGYISDILSATKEDKLFAIDDSLLDRAIDLNKEIEKKYDRHFVAEPGTFFNPEQTAGKYPTEITTPPNIAPPKRNNYEDVLPGVYVTVTGIPGLDDLFSEVEKIGLKIYTNKPEVVRRGIPMPPHILGHHKIVLHFARGGWGATWGSMLTGVPFVTPEYSGTDDPEIYYNNKCIERHGLGKVYRGETLPELLLYVEEFKNKAEDMRKYLLNKYGTLNGVEYTANHIVKHFLSTL